MWPENSIRGYVFEKCESVIYSSNIQPNVKRSSVYHTFRDTIAKAASCLDKACVVENVKGGVSFRTHEEPQYLRLKIVRHDYVLFIVSLVLQKPQCRKYW